MCIIWVTLDSLKAINIKMVAARIAKIANFPLSAIAFICL